MVELEQRAGTGSVVVARAPIRLSPGSPVYLKIGARGGRYDFWYANQPNDWLLLKGDADGTILSTKVAGGFVGTMFGMYAYASPPN